MSYIVLCPCIATFNKPWFNEECSELANKRKQTELLWLQNPNDQTAEYFSNVRLVTCRMFRENKRHYMKANVNKLEENSKNTNIREMYKGINEFKKGYQPRAYVIIRRIDQPSTTYLAFGKYLKRSGKTIRTYVSYL